MNAPAKPGRLAEFPISDKCLGETPLFEDAPAWIYNHDNPYLHGVNAPTTKEIEGAGLVVEGELPADLRGSYYRNGTNPFLSPMGVITPLMATVWYMPCTSVRVVRTTLTVLLKHQR